MGLALGHVALSPEQAAFTRIAVPANSVARVLVSALSAALLMPWLAAAPPLARSPNAGSSWLPAPLLMLTMRAEGLRYSRGSRAWATRQAP